VDMRVIRLIGAAVLGCALAVAVVQGLAVADSVHVPVASPSAQSGPLAAQPILTATLFPSKDNTLFENDGDVSNGAGSLIFVGRAGVQAEFGKTARRGLLAFPIASAIPPGSTILTTTLRLTLVRIPNAPPVPQLVALHRVTQNWGEGTSAGSGQGAAASPGDATWLHTFYSSTLWSAAGGDFVITASQAITVGYTPNEVYTWTTTPRMAADVQGWVNAPNTNYGWLLLGDELTAYTARGFGSREAITDTRPVLIVQYTLPPYSVYLPLVRK
jgi:hypothetical protein